MRLSEPRVPPLSDADAEGDAKELLEGAAARGRVLNITRTLAQYPALSRSWGRFGRHVIAETSLPPRERELLILRTGWRCRSGYEFGQHRRMGREAGLTDAEIARVIDGPDAPGWAPFDATLLRAADELHDDAFVSDATWAALAERYSHEQLMDVVFTVGQYHLVSMALNSLGVQLEPGTPGFPE
jgi:4-carboxymuconolactone decarboxylase